jgi:opacity protein-like surface antigen
MKADKDFDSSPQFDVGAFGGGQFWKLRQGNDPLPDKLVRGGVFGQRATWDFARYFGLEEAWSIRGTNNIQYIPAHPLPGQSVSFGARNTQLSVSPVAYLTPRTSRFRPFLTVGPGFEWFFPTSDAKAAAASAQNAALGAQNLSGRYGAVVTWGGGVKYVLSPRFLVRIDYHGTWAKHPQFGLTNIPAHAGGLYVPTGGSEIGTQLTVGLDFRFHRPAPPAATK